MKTHTAAVIALTSTFSLMPVASPQAQTLERFAAFPADTFAPGPTSGQFIAPANGRTPPFVDSQPVQGVSSVLRASNGDFLVMSDNGFGAQNNSADYVLRVYRISPDFRTKNGGSGGIDVRSFFTLQDPYRRIPFPIVADGEFYYDGVIPVDPAIRARRLLTGADFDIESFREAPDGTLWFGDEFGPFLLHTDRAGRALAHSVHVEVTGLQPGRDYFYQFDVRREESPIGHFRTAPSEHELAREVTFAFATCQDWPSGYYTAYRDMLRNDLDLVLHLGDYTYEYAIGATGRGIPVPEGFAQPCLDLRTYRLRHTLHKLDADLQAVHAKFPFVVIWDDHEVANDYSGLAPEYGVPSPEFTARRAAAYQAYYEHMPIRSAVAQKPRAGLRIYRRLRYGKLVEFTMLDDRQYRSDNPCGDGESLRCDAALDGDYSMLGRQQEQWVARGFERSSARWNVVAQQLLIAELEHATIQPNWFWNDAWDGYPLARRRLLSDVVDAKLRNPVFLTGDWHSTFVNDLKLDFKDPGAETIATEFVTPAITTGGDGTPYGPYYAPMIPYNPHIKYYEGDRRGYFRATVTPKRMRVDLRFVTSVENPSGSGYTEGSWVVEDGQAGAFPA